MAKLCLFFLAASSCFGQRDWIHSDAARLSPPQVRIFLSMICPGQERASGCRSCPGGIAPSAAGWDTRAIFQGHFLSSASEDTLVSGSGCESHANGFGGSFLFTRTGSSWRRVRYVAGMNAFDCKKLVGSDGRDRLLCAAADGGQGNFASWLYLLDPTSSQDDRGVIFFRVEHTIGAPPLPDGIMQSGTIDRVEFVNLPANPAQVRITVFASLGKAKVPAGVVESRNSGSVSRLEIRNRLPAVRVCLRR